MTRVEEVHKICGKCYEELGIITPIFEIEGNNMENVKTHVHTDKWVEQYKTKLKIVETLEEPEYIGDEIWFQDLMD